MTTHNAVSARPEQPSATRHRSAARVSLAVLLLAVPANLLLYGIGRAAGTEFIVQTPFATEPESVAWLHVLAMSVLPILVGGLLLRLLRRWAPGSWLSLAWAGLAVGIVSMPLWAEATAATKVLLSLMHLVPAVGWWIAVRRENSRVTS